MQALIAAGEALDAGRVDVAEQRLAPVLASHPGHPEVLRMQAGIHDLRGRHQLAIRVMRQALALRPRDPLHHNTPGAPLGNAGEYEAAIDALRTTCAWRCNDRTRNHDHRPSERTPDAV